MKRALFTAAFALMSGVAIAALPAGPAEAHSATFTTTCTTATLTAISYPAGTVMDINVDGSSAAHLVLAKPSYQVAPAVLTTTFPGTGHTVTGTITSPDKAPFVQTEQTTTCSSSSPSVTTSVSASSSVSSTASATGSSPSSTSSASISATQSSSASPSSTVSTSVEATSSTKPSVSPSATTSGGAELPHTGGTPGLMLAGFVVLASGCALIGLANRRRRPGAH